MRYRFFLVDIFYVCLVTIIELGTAFIAKQYPSYYTWLICYLVILVFYKFSVAYEDFLAHFPTLQTDFKSIIESQTPNANLRENLYPKAQQIPYTKDAVNANVIAVTTKNIIRNSPISISTPCQVL